MSPFLSKCPDVHVFRLGQTSIDTPAIGVETLLMLKKVVSALLVIGSLTVSPPFDRQVSANRPRSVTCTKPNWSNPGPYRTKAPYKGLNDAQVQAIDCSLKIIKVTTRSGPCVCFAAMLMNLIGDNQYRDRSWAANTDAWPRWQVIAGRSDVNMKIWLDEDPGNKPPTDKPIIGNFAKYAAPYAIYWKSPIDRSGHVATYIGLNSDGKHVFLDNYTAKNSPHWLAIGNNKGWPNRNNLWPEGASKLFFHPGPAPQHCRP